MSQIIFVIVVEIAVLLCVSIGAYFVTQEYETKVNKVGTIIGFVAVALLSIWDAVGYCMLLA